MLTRQRTTGMFRSRPSLWRLALFVVGLLGVVRLDNPAPCAEPLPHPVEGFRLFLVNDMDRLGKLVDLRRKTDARIDMREEHKEQNAYYQKVVASLDAQINTEVKASLDKAAALERQVTSVGVAAGVLRLRAWEAADTRAGLERLDMGGLYARLSAKFASGVAEVVANGRPRDQAALCVLLGEDAIQARTLKGEGRSYLLTLQKQIPQVVKLSQEIAPQDRIVREAAAVALAQMHAPATDLIAVVKMLLARDGANAADRRAAYKALILPFETAAPSTLATAVSAVPTSGPEKAAYDAEMRDLLGQQASLAVPVLVKGLKDDDVDVRTICVNGLRDIAAIARELLLPPPRLGQQAPDFEFGIKPMMELIGFLQPLIDQVAANAPALAEAAADPNSSVRLQALTMLNSLVETRNRIRGWQEQFERAAPPAPAKPPEALPVALEAQQPPTAKAPADKLTPALTKALTVLAKNLYDPDDDIRLDALRVLENLGPDADSPQVIPALLHALQDKNKYARWNAIRIFNRFGPIDAKRVVPILVALVRDQDGDGDYAKMLGSTLSAYGTDAAAAVPFLIKAIQYGEPDARIAFLQALTYVGPTAAEAVPVITAMVKDNDAHVRRAAAETLGRFGKAAAGAAPNLRAILDDENPDVRKAAAESLLRIDEK